MVQDIDSFARENQAFHGHLYSAAPHRFLVKTLQALHDSVALLGPTAINSPEWVALAIRQHSEIVEAIAARDAAQAGELTRTHIRNGFERRVQALKRSIAAPVRRVAPA